MYPNYPVTAIRSIKDLLVVMNQKYYAETAFSCAEHDWTYGEIVESVLKISPIIGNLKQQMLRIETNNLVSFSILYLSCVIIGKIAVLDNGDLPIDKDIISISESLLSCMPVKAGITIADMPQTDCSTVCTIICSSGTSSIPKGIMLSQENICADIVCSLQKYSMKRGDRFVNIIPPNHVFGLIGDVLCPLLSGATVFVLKDKHALFTEMTRIRPTMMNVPPVIAEMMLRLIKNGNDSIMLTGGMLRKVLCGGAGLKADVAKELRQYGIKAYGCYGLSETAACVSINRDEDYKDGSAGIPIDCNKVEIAEDGEILVSGMNVMKGYYDDPIETNRVLRDGKLYTGDTGYIDDNGFLFITGRKSNLIVFSDGTKCQPEVLEKIIVENTAAEEAMVFQYKDPLGEALGVKVYSSNVSCQESISEFINAGISKYKFDQVIFCNEPLPKNATGKIRRVKNG